MIRTLLEELIGEDSPTPDTDPHVNLDHNLLARNVYNNQLRESQRSRIPEIEGKIRALLPEKKKPSKSNPDNGDSNHSFRLGYNHALDEIYMTLGLTGKDTE